MGVEAAEWLLKNRGLLAIGANTIGFDADLNINFGKSVRTLNMPLVVAECVEQTWHIGGNLNVDVRQPHLSQALWLTAGCRGMRVWMPLFPVKQSQQPQTSSTTNTAPSPKPVTAGSDNSQATNNSFISKRIMLPFELSFYPLLICASECLALGVDEPHGGGGVPHRCSEVYLHHVLRQLLKRNLGLYALQIAGTCRHLPYFAHVLELLLHNVLEEEATTSEPIPDPLLPRVIAFIQEFPEFLQTVAHCARKTELALWRQLFACAGNPRDLFDVCLRDKQLETAVSFLIVLQSMEPTAQSKDQAMCLLEAALLAGHWTTARDICRFLRAIDPSDMESPTFTASLKQQAHSALGPRLSMVSPSDNVHDAFVFGYYGFGSRQRLQSATSPTDKSFSASVNIPASNRPNSMGSNEDRDAPKLNSSVGSKPPRTPTTSKQTMQKTNSAEMQAMKETNAIHVHLNMILTKHARRLLSTCRLRDLARERSRAARVDDWVSALCRLHADFQWPYPLLSETVVQRIAGGENRSGNANKQPLTVITRRSSFDSGLNGSSVTADTSDSHTRRLLMKQNVEHNNLTSGSGSSPVPPHDSESDVIIGGGTLREARLQAQEHNGTEQASDATSLVSSPADAARTPTDAQSGDYDWESLDKAVDSAGRGSQQHEAELRFLQQLMLESVCLEWSTLLALLLRDPVALARAVNVQSVAQAPSDTLQRLTTALALLDDWADSNCLGYKPLISAAQRHTQMLQAFANTNEKLAGISKPTVLRTASGSAEAPELTTKQTKQSNSTPTAAAQQQQHANATSSNQSPPSSPKPTSKSAAATTNLMQTPTPKLTKSHTTGDIHASFGTPTTMKAYDANSIQVDVVSTVSPSQSGQCRLM